MYDHDPADIEEVGWDRFVADAWTEIFVGYQSLTGIRVLGRRWSDLLQAGLGCPPEIADELVSAEVIQRQDRDLMIVRDPSQLLEAMDEVLADMGADLAELPDIRPADRDRLLISYHHLRTVLRAGFLAADEAGGARSAEGTAAQ